VRTAGARIDGVRERGRSKGDVLDIHVHQHARRSPCGKRTGFAMDNRLEVVTLALVDF